MTSTFKSVSGSAYSGLAMITFIAQAIELLNFLIVEKWWLFVLTGPTTKIKISFICWNGLA